MTCKHTRHIPGHWVKRPNFDQEEYDAGGFEIAEDEWVGDYEQSTTVDVNIHQYKCTQCGKIMNY